MLVYSDLDNTLVNPIISEDGEVIAILPRPWVHEFIEKLARDGTLYMLTAASRGHAERAMSILWPASKNFKGIISMEDMKPIQEQLDVIFNAPGLSEEEKLRLFMDVKPIAPPGVMFDNYPVGSPIYFLKAGAIGIGPDEWIEVEHFGDGERDRGGLKKAYAEWRRRYPFLLQMDGRRKRA